MCACMHVPMCVDCEAILTVQMNTKVALIWDCTKMKGAERKMAWHMG